MSSRIGTKNKLNFGLWELDVSDIKAHIILSNAWENSTHNNDVYEMPKFSSDCGIGTHSSNEQITTEDKCRNKIKKWLLSNDIKASAYLERRKTIEYLLSGLGSLPRGYQSQDCARTWVVYWILNSLHLLNADLYVNDKMCKNIISFLKSCQCKNTGGFGGGPRQYAHIAASFGAVMALMTIGTKEAYDAVDREMFYKFLLTIKQDDGSYCTQKGGEIDIRAIYCGLACAAILNIMDYKLCEKSIEWLNKCQTYQGGFSQEPNDEAHGGYAYCGLATLIIIKEFLGKEDQIKLGIYDKNLQRDLFNFDSLLRWSSMKQMSYSGGFCGRTNKLVDACYSFWVGSLFPMINIVEHISNKIDCKNNNEEKENTNAKDSKDSKDNKNGKNENTNEKASGNDSIKKRNENEFEWQNYNNIEYNCYFDSLQLQKYLIIVAQWHNGGITDKPFKPADYYHTCYGLSGLSLAQHYGKLLGPPVNLLQQLDPVFGIVSKKAIVARSYFQSLPRIKHQVS